MTSEQATRLIVESVNRIVTEQIGGLLRSLARSGAVAASPEARRIGRLWRCTWMRPDLASVEWVMPPQQALDELKGGLGVSIIRSALVRCIDVPDNPMEHACFVEADTVEGAMRRARDLHPDWQSV